MNEARYKASCVVFEGKIVVSVGFNINNWTLNTVEAYDHIDDSWANMQNMIVRRDCHNSVAIKNKLFVIGGLNSHNIEVLDSSSKKFALLQLPPIYLNLYNIAAITTIGKKVVLFSNKEGSVFLYDVENDVWSAKSCKATKHIEYFFCASLPQ